MALHWKCDRCGGWDFKAVDRDAFRRMEAEPEGWRCMGDDMWFCGMCASAFDRWLKSYDSREAVS